MSYLRAWCSAALFLFAPCAFAVPDLKFDVYTFGGPDGQSQFNHLNFPTTNGHYIAMGSDTHRLELATNGNALAIYYDTFHNEYPTNTASQEASTINNYAVSGFTQTGLRPDWVVLNEISTFFWQNDPTYRVWVHDVVHALKNTYGFSVIIYSPFSNPGNNSSDWQAVSSDAWIGIENYLSGADIQGQSFSVSWCQSQYQISITDYTALGVARAKLMLGEHFSQTTTGTGYGRSGVSSNAWDSAIVARNQAAVNLAFTGFLSYAWGGNPMGVPTNEITHFEDTYRTSNLPSNVGLTAPFILIQPQSQTLPEGSDVNFVVFRAGIAPTTYQWRFNGTNLPGATASSLIVTNIQLTNSGNYSVLVSNAVGAAASSNAFLNIRVPDPIAFDPFAPAITAYNPGDNLIGQTNAAGRYWIQAGSSGPQPAISAGSLAVGGLAGASGNSVTFGGNGISARFNLGTNTSTSTFYYSFAFKLNDITGLSSSGVFWAGFNNSAGSQTGQPTSVGTRVVTRSSGSGYNVGLDKSSGSAAAFAFAPDTFTTNDIVFLVASYTFNSGATNDDLSQMWVNPPASTFGQATVPAPTLSNTNGADISAIASFVLFNRNAAEPASVTADDVRVGTSWASVTPPAEAPVVPSLNLGLAAANVILSWTTNAPGFVPESTAALAAPSLWNPITSPFYVIGSQYFVTNTPSGSSTFYRLRSPQ